MPEHGPKNTSVGSPDSVVSASPEVSLPGYNLAQGLFEFYSSQAAAMLAQFRNINQIIGPTKDWTAPGTLCEVLIRDLVRRILPTQYSVDKGFIFGRCRDRDKEVHSPEIDVLIHDTFSYAPVYRLEDFVIVRPDAVRGVIQVKRTLDGGTLAKAIRNLVNAKQHLKSFNVTRIPNKDNDVFSAAVFFADDLKLESGKISEEYKSAIESLKAEDHLVRPHFLGSLSHRYYVVPTDCPKNSYDGFPSQHSIGNASLVTFLGYLTHYILPSYSSMMLYLPHDHKKDQSIPLPLPEDQET